MGFQRLRIFPCEYPLAWRLCVTLPDGAEQEIENTWSNGAPPKPQVSPHYCPVKN